MDGSKCDRTPGCTGTFDGGYCDTCGLATADKQAASASPDPALASATATPTPTGPTQNCPDCSEPYNAAEGDFCTVCAYNFKTGEHGAPAPAPVVAKPVESVTTTVASGTTSDTATAASASTTPGARRWTATVRVDTTRHAQAPQAHPEAVFDLFDGSSEALLGRRDVDVFPDIPVSSGDPAVSRRHAKVTCAADGSLRVRDQSKFGTQLVKADGSKHDLLPGVEHPKDASDPIVIEDGDSLVIGEWTVVLFNAK
jgi:hypothetical protein